MAEEVKQDMIDRKGAWIERMFDRLFLAIQANPFATLLVLSVGLNFYQYSVNNELNRLRIQDITTLNERINIAVEKRVTSAVAPIKQDVVDTKTKVDSLKLNADTSLSNLNGTVESVKQYFNNNKRK